MTRLLRPLTAKTRRLSRKTRSTYATLAVWAETPEGRLARWIITVLLAGHASG
ncbi:hypothetical protein [Streptomyces sp. NPDC008141]|uniref:hypothetical protein n=1 Tax=Streptomyces sp. NPDC008141 TaxID=3364815 RepID=UPI0036E9BC24